MRTVRFAPVRPTRTARYWARKGNTLGKIGKLLGMTFAGCVALIVALIVCGVVSGVILTVLTNLFSITR